jgi:hypothetical protein
MIELGILQNNFAIIILLSELISNYQIIKLSNSFIIIMTILMEEVPFI